MEPDKGGLASRLAYRRHASWRGIEELHGCSWCHGSRSLNLKYQVWCNMITLISTHWCYQMSDSIKTDESIRKEQGLWRWSCLMKQLITPTHDAYICALRLHTCVHCVCTPPCSPRDIIAWVLMDSRQIGGERKRKRLSWVKRPSEGYH
jgi:hypothetical protein